MLRTFRSARVLRKHWKLTAIAVFSLSVALALGILSLSIANTFLFLQPAAPEPDRLVSIHTRTNENTVDQISYPDLQFYRQNNRVFTDMAAEPNSITIYGDDDKQRTQIRVFARPVSENYFAVLGLRPFLGRFFITGDDESKTSPAVMTYSCWQRLGQDRQIVGKVIAGHSIVGVTPKDYKNGFYGFGGDLFVSLSNLETTPAWRTRRDKRLLFLTARLKPGVTLRQAQVEMAGLSRQLAAAYPRENRNRTAIVTSKTLIPPDGVASARLMTGILVAIVLLVLLIACANVASLLLAVAVGRRHETAVKLAMGASRNRLIREFLKESAIICVVSGILGYMAAAVVIAKYSAFSFAFPLYGAFSFELNLRLDATVLAFTGALVLLAILITGLPPAFYASAPAVNQVLGGEIVVGGTGKNLRRNLLVIAQIATCTLVCVGMGLCQRSLYNLRHVDTGFSARKVLAAQLASDPKTAPVFEAVRLKTLALPGVEAATLASDLPLLTSGSEPVRFTDGSKTLPVSQAVVDSNYFETFKLPLLSGRAFNDHDLAGHPEAIIVNRKMATTFWPGQDPLGKPLTLGEPARHGVVVGVAADGKYEELGETARPFLYLALSQHKRDLTYLALRTTADPRLSIEPLSRLLRKEGLAIVLTPFTLESWMNLTLLIERLTATGVSILSGLGLFLACIGLFGSISWSVTERRKEMGIRAALGARPKQLLTMILHQTALVTGTGIAAGAILGIGATMLLRSHLFGIGPLEWPVLTSVTAGMLAVCLLVAGLSANPSTKADPMDAVRHA